MCFKLIKKRNNINSLSLHQFPYASINSVSVGKRSYKKKMNMNQKGQGHPTTISENYLFGSTI